MSREELFEIVEEIPKAEKKGGGKKVKLYDELFDSIKDLDIGIKGKFTLGEHEKDIQNIYSALLSRKKAMEKRGDLGTRTIKFLIRNPKRQSKKITDRETEKVKTIQTLIGGDLYFSIEEK